MIRLEEIDQVYVEEDLSGFTKQLVQDGIFPRQIDLLLLGFSYAVAQGLAPPDRIKRHDLIRAGGIKDDVRLVIETVASWYARRRQLPEFDSPRALLDFICRLGSEGVRSLQKEWEGKAKSQIELAILKISR